MPERRPRSAVWTPWTDEGLWHSSTAEVRWRDGMEITAVTAWMATRDCCHCSRLAAAVAAVTGGGLLVQPITSPRASSNVVSADVTHPGIVAVKATTNVWACWTARTTATAVMRWTRTDV